jgi:hypothetical protein
METPLKMLCEKNVSDGDKTISWDRADTDVALNFETHHMTGTSWVEGSVGYSDIEHLNGLNIIINT